MTRQIATQKRRDYVDEPKTQQSILLGSYWEFADQKLSQLEILLFNNETVSNILGFLLDRFLQFSRQIASDLSRKLQKSVSQKTQNVLDQFHCRTIKFLVENSFWSALSPSYPTKYHSKSNNSVKVNSCPPLDLLKVLWHVLDCKAICLVGTDNIILHSSVSR